MNRRLGDAIGELAPRHIRREPRVGLGDGVSLRRRDVADLDAVARHRLAAWRASSRVRSYMASTNGVDQCAE